MDILSKQIIELARSAPSLHNTQPWYFVLNPSGFSLYIDRHYVLADGDALGRELWISIGAMIECIVQSAAALGIDMSYSIKNDSTLDQPVASFSNLEVKGRQDLKKVQAISDRRSFRGDFVGATLSSKQRTTLQEACKALALSRTHAHLALDETTMHLVADLTKRGMAMALQDEHFSSELSKFVLPNWSKARRGMHGRVLGKSGALSSWWESFSIAHHIGISKKAHAEQASILDSAGLILITSTGDTPPFWLESGRLYYGAALALQTLGYASSTLAATVEAGSFHEEVEAQIGTKERLQAVLRFGKAPTRMPEKSARLSVDELIRSQPNDG